jgi:hypothetical protein
MFDAEKGWMLELYGSEYSENKCSIVKLTVASSFGSAESNYLPVFKKNGGVLFVLTRDSMDFNLNINPLGDKITVITEYLVDDYHEIQHIEDVLIFGNYQGSQIKAPFEGQSIGCAGYDWFGSFRYYAKTNEPTMGAPNDISKMYGTLKGKVYDKNNQLVLNDSISFARYNEPYLPSIKYDDIDEDGSYSTNVLANRLSKDYVYFSNKKIKIKPIKIDIEPDAIYEQDIHLLEDYTGIKEISIIDNSPIRIYPNPLSGGQELQYEVGVPVKSLDCRMEIISMDGRILFESKIANNTGSINLPHSLPNGVYIVNFKLNNKIQYATRLIVGK